jgi:hypothetical protein
MKYLHTSLLIIFIFFAFAHQQAKGHDTGQVISDETKRLIHQMSINVTHGIFRNIPSIFDSVSATIRQQVDKEYKCSIQPDDYKNKECHD